MHGLARGAQALTIKPRNGRSYKSRIPSSEVAGPPDYRLTSGSLPVSRRLSSLLGFRGSSLSLGRSALCFHRGSQLGSLRVFYRPRSLVSLSAAVAPN